MSETLQLSLSSESNVAICIQYYIVAVSDYFIVTVLDFAVPEGE
jgi:hypothetical protein